MKADGFYRLVCDHFDWIARLAFRYRRRREDAEDLAQETLLRILAAADRYDHARDFKPWAWGIMHNLAASQYRRAGLVPFCGLDGMTAAIAAGTDSEARLLDVQMAVSRAAARCIGVECAMYYAAGYSYAEIAERTGVGVGTVRSRISAGRKAIRAELGR